MLIDARMHTAMSSLTTDIILNYSPPERPFTSNQFPSSLVEQLTPETTLLVSSLLHEAATISLQERETAPIYFHLCCIIGVNSSFKEVSLRRRTAALLVTSPPVRKCNVVLTDTS